MLLVSNPGNGSQAAQSVSASSLSLSTRQCSYNTYEWNTLEKKAINYRQIIKPYAEISDEEKDEVTGCSVCEEDQMTLVVENLKPFKMCRYVAEEIESLLVGLLASGIPIVEVTGYRVGKTRGEVDDEGNRTVFSNHSFGTAIDLNAQSNGLYDQCISFDHRCRLIRGGEWYPDRETSWKSGGPVVTGFKSIGYRWGGEIQGWQKDFMHFSPTGY